EGRFSAAGRASHSECGGQVFESPKRHHFFRAASGRKPSRDGRRGPSAWELRGYEVSAPAVGRRHGGINLIVQLQNARDYTGMVQYAFGGGERWFGRIMTNSPRRSITLCRQSW